MNRHTMENHDHARRALRLATVLMGSTVLAGLPAAALAQTASPEAVAAPAAAAVEAPAPAPEMPAVISSITVAGAQRLEPDTIRSYIKLRVGQPYTQQSADQALKDLFATELFADALAQSS